MDPDEVCAIQADMFITELESKKAELDQAWMEVKMKTTDEDELAKIITREEVVLAQLSQKRIRAKTFSAQVKALSSVGNREPAGTLSVPSPTVSSTKLQKMTPPKFSGDIHDFARFRADFEKIVEPEYRDPVHQIYVMKEKCLQGEARDLVLKPR